MEQLKARHGADGLDRLDSFREVEVDLCLAILGLTGCANTIIGDETLKGVSGAFPVCLTHVDLMLFSCVCKNVRR